MPGQCSGETRLIVGAQLERVSWAARCIWFWSFWCDLSSRMRSVMSADDEETPGKALEKRWCLSLFLKALLYTWYVGCFQVGPFSCVFAPPGVKTWLRLWASCMYSSILQYYRSIRLRQLALRSLEAQGLTSGGQGQDPRGQGLM